MQLIKSQTEKYRLVLVKDGKMKLYKCLGGKVLVANRNVIQFHMKSYSSVTINQLLELESFSVVKAKNSGIK